MGSIGGMLGIGGGAGGSGFATPQQATIQSPTTDEQAKQQYAQAQAGLANQNAFLQATQPGGLQALQSQQQLLAQLGDQAQGNGPNPALAQLNQTTGQNVANQAALMASQRGSNANTGMMARQAAMQSANQQQNAVGQAATLKAQQQLAAQQALAQQQAQMAGQQAGATNAYAQSAQNEQNNILNAIGAQNNARVGMQSNVNNANAGLAGQRMGQQGQIVGNLMGGVGSALGMFAEGGEVPQKDSRLHAFFSNPGAYTSPVAAAPIDIGSVNIPEAPAMFKQPAPQAQPKEINTVTPAASNLMDANRMPQNTMMAAEGGKVPALLSPGERYLSPEKVEKVAQGADPIKEGKLVPGKPKVGGAKNSYKNDTVKAELEEGGIVLPRSVTESKHPHWAAMKFVQAINAKKGKLPKKG